MKGLLSILLSLGCVIALIAAEISPAEVQGATKPVTKSDIRQSDSTAQPVQLRLSRAVSSTRSGELILWQVVSSGATDGVSPTNRLVGTIGQTVVGEGSSADLRLSHGFWQDFGAGGACCLGPIRGNVDYDLEDKIDISDLVYLVDYMFSGGLPPVCVDEADIDGSGEIDITDLVYLVDYMFSGGPPPPAC